jgi:DNA processing protein
MKTMKPHDDAMIKAAIELSLLPGVGCLTQNRILNKVPNLSQLFSLNNEELVSLGVPKEAHAIIRSRGYQPMSEEIHDWAIRENCQILLKGAPGYPELLAEIFDPPLLLYVRGRLETLLQPCISVVGTRKPTIYGLQMAQGIAADLGSRGISVVSGLARGIDAAAHRGCIDNKGATIAILGSGIDNIYPKEHKQLADKIIQTGLLMTEFAPGTSPAPQNFPVRNRIISGLSFGTIIIEAQEYSGSLITARLAMEQNREVFALPGNLTSPQSFGPNFLIKQGAKLVQSWRDVVEELPANIRQDLLIKEDVKLPDKPELDMISDEAKNLLTLIKEDEATHFDKLFSYSQIPISELSSQLLSLEMAGRIRQLPGNLYVKIRKQTG